MPLTQLDSENGDYDLTSLVTVLTHTPSTTEHRLCQAYIALGDGSKNLDGSGGDFEVVGTVGGQTVQPSPQTVAFGSQVRAALWTTPFPVPANQQVVLKVKSPNAADTDVDVTALQFDLPLGSPAATEIADAVLTRDVSNVEATAPEHCLCTVILATLESSLSDTTWTIKRTGGSTTHATMTATTDANANPFIRVNRWPQDSSTCWRFCCGGNRRQASLLCRIK